MRSTLAHPALSRSRSARGGFAGGTAVPQHSNISRRRSVQATAAGSLALAGVGLGRPAWDSQARR
jgi:hypothetical protein